MRGRTGASCVRARAASGCGLCGGGVTLAEEGVYSWEAHLTPSGCLGVALPTRAAGENRTGRVLCAAMDDTYASLGARKYWSHHQRGGRNCVAKGTGSVFGVALMICGGAAARALP